MKANKIRLNGEVLLDLTTDTATPETVAEGVTFHMADGTPATGSMIPTEDLDAELTQQEDLIANLKEKLTSGSGGGGGVELNIAYGDTPPEDTTKLWVKTSEPNNVLVCNEVDKTEISGESIVELDVRMPTALNGAGIASVGSKIYIFGGTDRDSNGINAVLCYDIETETFENHPGVLGTAITHVMATAIGTKIYLVGGGSKKTTASKTIRCFDTETMTITTCATELPVALYGALCGAIGQDLYIFYGKTSSSFPKVVYKYDTVLDSITTVAETPHCEYFAQCTVIGNTFYFYGGSGYPSQVVWFDTASLAYGLSPIISGSLGSACGGSFGNQYIYIIGGRTYARKMVRFDTVTKEFDTHTDGVPEGLRNASAITVGDKLFIFGGWETESNGSGTYDIVSTDKVRFFIRTAFAPLIEKDSLYVKPQTKNNTFPIVKTDSIRLEIGVDTVYKGNTDGIGEEVEAALYKDGEWTTI